MIQEYGQLPIMRDPKTTLITHLGEQFVPFYARLREYLMTPPYWHKAIGVGGKTASGKTEFINELRTVIDNDLELQSFLHMRGIEYREVYVKTGDTLAMGRRTGTLKSPQGKIKAREYRETMPNAGHALVLARSALSTRYPHQLWFNEYVLTTSVEDQFGEQLGVDRGWNWAVDLVSNGGLSVLMNGTENVAARALATREDILKTPESELKAVLKKRRIRSVGKLGALKKLYEKTGNEPTLRQQIRDEDRVMRRLILDRDPLFISLVVDKTKEDPWFEIPDPFNLNKDPQRKFEFIKAIYYPYIQARLFETARHENAFIFSHDVVPESEEFEFSGESMIDISIFKYLEQLRGRGYARVRKALVALGALPKSF